MKLRQLFAATAIAAASVGAHAHNVWLLPSATVLSKADWITVDAAVSNDLFFFNHNPLRLDNLAVTAPDGTAVNAENKHTGKFRSVFDLQLKQAGTYRLAVTNGGLFANWKDKATGQAKRWRGTPDKLSEIPADAVDLNVVQSLGRVETYVTVGKPSALKPTGQGLEFVPVTHPNDLVKGEKATFAFTVDGQPVPGMEVVLVNGGTRWRDKLDEIKATTDAKGQFSVTWPSTGVYWIDADHKDAKTSVPQAKERRLSYVGTVEVLP